MLRKEFFFSFCALPIDPGWFGARIVLAHYTVGKGRSPIDFAVVSRNGKKYLRIGDGTTKRQIILDHHCPKLLIFDCTLTLI
jgi:hypothetical protein